jgi:hypothetical protein
VLRSGRFGRTAAGSNTASDWPGRGSRTLGPAELRGLYSGRVAATFPRDSCSPQHDWLLAERPPDERRAILLLSDTTRTDPLKGAAMATSVQQAPGISRTDLQHQDLGIQGHDVIRIAASRSWK